MNVQDKLKEIIATLEAAQADARKFDVGINAPGTRIRKALSQAAAECKALRGHVQAVQAARGERR